MALPDVVIIGAGVVGAACAFYTARAGLSVTVVDRAAIGAGSTGTGQGAVLASDKPLGPALDLAVDSLRRWGEMGAELGAAAIGLARTGALAVAATADERDALLTLAKSQRAAGVDAEPLGPEELADREPLLAPGFAGGVSYPGDLRVDPVSATAHLLRASGADVRRGVEVRGVELDAGMRVAAVRTTGGERISCGAVVNAAGVWGGEVAAMAGTPLPVTPRRGFVLVTEPLTGRPVRRPRPQPRRSSPVARSAATPPIRHTVYAAPYADTVTADDPGAQVATVVTTNRAGAVEIGASRERIGFDRTWSLPVLRRLAAGAAALFPFLADVAVLRAYRGFRPDTPDRLPAIGADPWIGGLFHACGHEGAGVCLAPATGALIAGMLAAGPLALDPFAFSPERFG